MQSGSAFNSKKRIGEMLIAEGFINSAQLEEALELQERWGTKIGQILIATGLVRRIDMYRTLAKHLDLPFLDLTKEKIDPAMLRLLPLDFMAKTRTAPVRMEGDSLLVALSDPMDEELEKKVKEIAGLPIKKAITTDLDVLWILSKHFESELRDVSVFSLYRENAMFSARRLFTDSQLVLFLVFGSAILFGAFFNVVFTLTMLNMCVQVVFFLAVSFKLFLVLIGIRARIKGSSRRPLTLDEKALPVYTVLVPIYKEAKVLPHLIGSIRRLNYPKSKLDVKILLEQDDTQTLEAAKKIGPEAFFEFVVVPTSYPKTKPKACNWGLQFARGKYLTIFDAEDEPDPNQLKKALLAFSEDIEHTICVQGRLNYFNVYENFITRMFTLEYSYWFDYMLPGLEALNVPIPLGGTSNHFDTEKLIKMRGWDPFNVTEDADLGVRATRLGYRVRTIDSTTYEEATSHVKSWINQRSRWVKGYMVTYAVHMRHPVQLYRELGFSGFLSFQLFIGGTPFAFLATPIMWVIYIDWLLTRTRVIDPFFPAWILYLSLINLLVCNGIIIFTNILAVWKRKLFKLCLWAFLAPFYWILHSIAAWKAQWQIMTKPFYWEKTTHGVSKQVRDLGLSPHAKKA